MPIVSFNDLITDAQSKQYAVGYFESWNIESLMAVADAAEAVHSPVILGFSGIYLTHPDRIVRENLGAYASLGIEVCRDLSVPTCLIYNESPELGTVLKAIELGFGVVMFSDGTLSFEDQLIQVKKVVEKAHESSVAVEGEILSLPGVGGELAEAPADIHLTKAVQGRAFVEETGVDALAVNIGQSHLHGRKKVHLNFERLIELRKAINIPLVLHGATSVHRPDIVEAIRCGISKINVGSILKQAYFKALRGACEAVNESYNPYEVIGSGFNNDVMVVGRMALQKTVEDLMNLFGSAGKA